MGSCTHSLVVKVRCRHLSTRPNACRSKLAPGRLWRASEAVLVHRLKFLRFVFIPTDKPHVLFTDHTVFFAAASKAHGTITSVSCAHTANFIVLLAGVRCRDAWWNMPMRFTTSEAYHFWFLIRGMCETCKPTHMLAACAVQLALTGTNCPCKERKFHISLPSTKT